MRTALIDRDFLPRSRLHELQQRSDGPGLRRLLAQALLYLGAAVVLLLAREPWLLALGLVASALVQFAMFGMLHEACHRTAFASPRLSLVASWFAALAQPMSPALMRAFHFTHHRHTHEIEQDPELARIPSMARWPRGFLWLVTMTGLPFLFARAMWALFAAVIPAGASWRRVLRFVRRRERRRIAQEARVLVFAHGALLVIGFLLYPPLLRIYLGMVLAHTLLAWYVTCEHRGLPTEGNVLERTRSLKASRPLRWLLWNMPYHAEHHAWPGVPWHQLPTLHEAVEPHLVHVESPLYLHTHAGRERSRPT